MRCFDKEHLLRLCGSLPVYSHLNALVHVEKDSMSLSHSQAILRPHKLFLHHFLTVYDPNVEHLSSLLTMFLVCLSLIDCIHASKTLKAS